MEIQVLSWNEKLQNRNNHPLLPRSFRGLLIGKSGCGKTTVLLSLLLQPNWLDYNNLKIFGMSLFQPEYKIIRKVYEMNFPKECFIKLFSMRDKLLSERIDPIKLLTELGRQHSNNETIKCEFYESAADVPDPKDLKSTDKNLVIFDDLQ